MEFIGMKTKRLMLIVVFLLGLSCITITNEFNTPPTAAPIQSTQTPVPTGTPHTAPVYVPTGCQSSAIATPPTASAIAEPTLEVATNPSLTRDQQFGVFAELVSTINNYYLYPDFNGVDWKGTVASYRAKVESGLETEVFYADMSDLVTALGDDHSQFESPSMATASDAELAGRNEFVGIGVIAQPSIDKGHLTVVIVFPNSPAEHGGIKAHDSLLAVDGVPLVENGKSFVQRIRGPECSTLRLTVQSPGREPRDVILMRYKITAPEPIDARLVPTTDGSHIGYIFIPTFFDDTIPDQIKNALNHFGPLDGLILDNRMNGGGSSNVVDPILSYFTSGTVGQFVSRTEKRPFIVRPNPINNSQTVPLVVLVGEDTVSYGEIFSGILQDESRAKIIGKTTLGNVETLHGYKFSDGSFAWIAQERFDPTHSHANWEKDGIVPDVQAFADWDTFTFENDPSVSAALKLLGHN
jgi:carboxyl-terminal processing protease